MNKRVKPFAKLRGRMAEMGVTQGMAAAVLGITSQAFSRKINGKFQFNMKEIRILKEYLELESVDEYFFA